jgi:hypothetical protein
MEASSRLGYSTESESVLRRSAVACALDVARIPLDGRLHHQLEACLHNFVALEGAMAATSDALQKAGLHAKALKLETKEWDVLVDQIPELSLRLEAVTVMFDAGFRRSNQKRGHFNN